MKWRNEKMNNYIKMNEMLENENLHEIAFADYADENVKLAFYVDDVKTLEVAITYDNIDEIQAFCDDIEDITDREFYATSIFDDILNGYAEQEVEIEIEQEDEEGHIWYITRRFEIEEVR